MRSNEVEIEGYEICKRNKVSLINSEPILLGIMDGDDIPEWLLIEVLIRLPAKLIFRLKLVCKHWISVISDPFFVRTYISQVSMLQPLQQPWVIGPQVMRYDCSKRFLDFVQFDSVENIYSRELKSPSYLVLNRPCAQQPQSKNYRIYSISNGIVLCCHTILQTDDLPSITRPTYNICNPVTGQWITLPSQTDRFSNTHTGFLTEVEDGILKSYRVVCLDLSSSRKRNTTRFSVFYSESGEWKVFSVNNDLEIGISRGTPQPFALHGNLHWVLYQNGILAYDPDQRPDGLRIITLPGDNNQRQRLVTCLCGVSDGKLRYFELSNILGAQHRSSSVCIWKLNDYTYGDWTLQHRIRRSDIVFDLTLRSLSVSMFPLLFDPYDPDIVYMGVTNVIVSFNIKTKRFEGHGTPLRVEEILVHDKHIYHGEMPWWMGRLFLIPPWPTSISPPSFKSVEKR